MVSFLLFLSHSDVLESILVLFVFNIFHFAGKFLILLSLYGFFLSLGKSGGTVKVIFSFLLGSSSLGLLLGLECKLLSGFFGGLLFGHLLECGLFSGFLLGSFLGSFFFSLFLGKGFLF